MSTTEAKRMAVRIVDLGTIIDLIDLLDDIREVHSYARTNTTRALDRRISKLLVGLVKIEREHECDPERRTRMHSKGRARKIW